jgi:ATP adenylyltransferase/5',5'''-P-1,P-4-tetraphosphate phosphorylase II
MQLMPMPKDSFAGFLDAEDGEEPPVPFAWFYRRFAEHKVSPATVTAVYLELLSEAEKVGHGRGEHAESAPVGAACPHNMILTERWIIVLPRRRAGVNREAGANAMGMLGYIAVATHHEMHRWIQLGLTKSLEQLGVPR